MLLWEQCICGKATCNKRFSSRSAGCRPTPSPTCYFRNCSWCRGSVKCSMCWTVSTKRSRCTNEPGSSPSQRACLQFGTRVLALLGDAYGRAGRVDEAVSSGQRALDLARRLGQRGDEAQTLYLLGKIHGYGES